MGASTTGVGGSGAHRVDAVVLAGGDGTVVRPGIAVKGLIPVHGQQMVGWVVRALRKSNSVRNIVVVLPTAEGLGPWTDLVDELVVSDGSFVENAVAGVEVLAGDVPVLAVTGDIPAVTSDAIDDFVQRTRTAGAIYSYALISRDNMERQVPGSVRTYYKIDGASFTGGNVIIGQFDPHNRSVRDLAQRFFDARKSPVKTAQTIGPSFAAKYALGTLTTADVERKLSQVFDAPCSAIVTPFAAIGADVDKPVDLEIIERLLVEREQLAVV